MSFFLLISRGIDRLNQSVGLFTTWLILATTLISAGNAIVRKAFDSSSNALLEIQWYLFAAVFLLGAGYGLLKKLACAHRLHLGHAHFAHAQLD